MDPWTCHSSVNVSKNILTKFEDNFIPEINKLPDHDKYLAVLESKLQKLKSDPNVLRQLLAKKDLYMQQLLSQESECNDPQLLLEEPISDSPLLRTLLPQRQALNQGEIVELIKYDQLTEDEGGDNNLSSNPAEKAKKNIGSQ